MTTHAAELRKIAAHLRAEWIVAASSYAARLEDIATELEQAEAPPACSRCSGKRWFYHPETGMVTDCPDCKPDPAAVCGMCGGKGWTNYQRTGAAIDCPDCGEK